MRDKLFYKEPIILGLSTIILIFVSIFYFIFYKEDTKATVDHKSPVILEDSISLNE